MARCYLGLGSNLRTPKRQLRQAIAALRKIPRTTIVRLSGVYISKPLGVRAQPTYYNMVIAIDTSLSPENLLLHCQSIENKQKRIRKLHWGARTLDIDILLYGHQMIRTHRLVVPHQYMLTRDFVLIPLLEIAPLVCMPNGAFVQSYLTCCEKHVYLN